VNISSEDGSLMSPPDIVTRGFVYVKESDNLMREMKDVVSDTVSGCAPRLLSDLTSLKSTIKSDLSQYLYKKAKRNPMIIPVVTEI
jgi:ribonuclease J